MKDKAHTYRLQLRVPPGDFLERIFSTKEEARAYAERIFLLHPDEDWREIFTVVEGKRE